MNEIDIDPELEYCTSVDVRGRVVLAGLLDERTVFSECAMSSSVARDMALSLRCGRTALPYPEACSLATRLVEMAVLAANMAPIPAGDVALYEALSRIDATSHRYHRLSADGFHRILLGSLAVEDLGAKLGWTPSQVASAVNSLIASGLIVVLGRTGDDEELVKLQTPWELSQPAPQSRDAGSSSLWTRPFIDS